MYGDTSFQTLYKIIPKQMNEQFVNDNYQFTFVDEDTITKNKYTDLPFPHTVIDDFFKPNKVDTILEDINNLQDEDSDSAFNDPNSPYEFNKYAFSTTYGRGCLEDVFRELNSPSFISYMEKLTGITGLVANELSLLGAGIHRIRIGGFLQLHTDFNTYKSDNGYLDRRINLLIYMNPDWKKEYNGELCLCDKFTNTCVKKISPLLNRAVIFNTTNKSIHGHPERWNVPNDDIRRQSIAVYYYTKNSSEGKYDFEGDISHSTIWHPSINV